MSSSLADAESGGRACVSPQLEAEPLDTDYSYVKSESDTPLSSQSYLSRLSSSLTASDETRPVNLAEARDAYRGVREPTDSYDTGPYLSRARKHVNKLLQTDRFKVAEYSEPHTVMLSLRVDPVADGVRIPPVNLFESIKSTWATTREKLRYQLSDKRGLEYEYACVVAGTDHWATPHMHIYLWIDGKVDKSAFRPAVDAFVSGCRFAPDDGRGNNPDDAVTIRGPAEQDFATDDVRQDMLEERGAATTGAHYLTSQIPHIAPPETATDTELLHGATVVAAPSNAVHFSSGCWTDGDGKTPPKGAIDYSYVSSEKETSQNCQHSPNSPGTPESLTPCERVEAANPCTGIQFSISRRLRPLSLPSNPWG